MKDTQQSLKWYSSNGLIIHVEYAEAPFGGTWANVSWGGGSL